jgi:hypothetical protein
MGIEAAVAGGALGGMLLAGMQKQPSIPAPTPVTDLPGSQAATTPTAGDVLKETAGTGQAGGAAGVGQTFLTGAGGVNQASLKLNKKSLYGESGKDTNDDA